MPEDGPARTDRGPVTADDMRARARLLRGAVLTMTTLAASGHPGGSMSSMELLLAIIRCARVRPDDPTWADRDRMVVSHGHISPGVYCVLADAGFFPLEDAVAHFRQAGSPFEGHVERCVPGVEWSTGNLGQGLSAGVGMALAARLTGRGWRTFVAMSDGEQMKGQVGEARRLAARQGLAGLTAVVDLNGVQISGHTRDVMPVDVGACFTADGWRVLECDGHDPAALSAAVTEAAADLDGPCAVLAHTVIGKGVSFMEDEPEYHGRGLTPDEYVRAMDELGLDAAWLDRAREERSRPCRTAPVELAAPARLASPGVPRTYAVGAPTDDRSAWGAALVDLASAAEGVPFAVLDCDLAESVKTKALAVARPDAFIECGVGEHNAATVAGALSVSGVTAFWADFGVFGCDEVYNQHRLNDINGSGVKLVLTHCGLDVGEDGKTHQCLDYVGAFRNLFGWRVVVPADPNQTDRCVREAATVPGNVALCMGRSKLPVIADGAGRPYFGDGYAFRWGRVDWLRRGSDATLLAMGTIVAAAVASADALAGEGVRVSVGVVTCPLELHAEDMEDALAAPVVFTVEDHGVRTGLGASVAEWLALRGRHTRLVRMGVEGYSSSGVATDLYHAAGLDADGITARIRGILGG
jgi:transketolase